MFNGGVTKFYATAPTGTIGPKSGTFLFPSPYADEIIKKQMAMLDCWSSYLVSPLAL